tara:strand:+ start:932 stop:1978 length:1047 start_codon:yes stop_codon:yes gene_type:complete
MLKPLLIITTILFFVGTGLYFFNEGSNFNKYQNLTQTNQKLLKQLNTKSLDRIKIFGNGSLVDLVQLQGGGWKEQSLNFEADIITIQNLLVNLSNISLGDLITDNPDYHERFQLLDPPENIDLWEKERHGFALNLLRGDGTSIVYLLLGKERTNGSGQYIRQVGSDKIYLIPEPLLIFDKADDWIRKDLLALDTKNIQRFDIQKGDNSSYSISRIDAESDWKNNNENPELIEESKINRLLSRLKDLSFSKLYKNNKITQKLSEQNYKEGSLSVSLFDGSVYSLIFDKNVSVDENYMLSLRMGISMEASGNSDSNDSKLRKQMEEFNQRVSSRLFGINSWEAKELLFIE